MSDPISLLFTGGINNIDTPLDLFLKGLKEAVSCINADTTLLGRLKLLRPLLALNTTAEGSSIHTVFVANEVVLVGAGANMKYWDGDDLTSILTGLAAASASMAHAGNWVYFGNGTDKQAVYLPDKTGCDWGQDVPSAAPTVAVGAAGSVKDNTYSCYYRYKITLPDGTIIRTGLSPVATVAITGADADKKIEWTGLVHADFTGATTNQIELFRTGTGISATYLVTTLDSGTTTYSDDVSDVNLILQTAFAETGYYPPPDGVDVAIYDPGSDRVFCTVGNNIYWCEAGLYHIFVYNATAGEYTNINSIFLAGENVTSLALFDEQLYIGSQKTWRRRRGTNPSYWTWEDINGAIKGPLNFRSVALTPWGLVYPGNDGHIWIFNGFTTAKVVEQFVFSTEPDTTAHASFDGRFYRLYYGDTTNPELVIDFFGFPNVPPRVVQSTRSASASFYDPATNEFYQGDSDGYLRNGADTGEEVTLTVRLAEVPIERLIDIGNAGSMLIHVNTQEDSLTITPYCDDEAQTPLSTIETDNLKRLPVPLGLNEYRTFSFEATITTKKDIELREPWLIRSEDDAEKDDA